MGFTFDDFKTRFPEFDLIDEDYYNSVKATAVLSVNPKIWLSKYDFGVMLLTAHYLSRNAQPGGASGPIKREKVGDLEREFATSFAVSSDLQTTTYGSEFLELMRTLLISPVIVPGT